jgi:hypothetical protein
VEKNGAIQRGDGIGILDSSGVIEIIIGSVVVV